MAVTSKSWAIALHGSCFIYAIYSVYILAISGGLLFDLYGPSLKKPRYFPDTQVVMTETWTGISLVDWHVNNLNSFWTPVIFRQGEGLTFFAPYFMLQWVASFAFLYLECLRLGNKGKAVGSFVLLGTTVQMIGFGPVAAFYLLAHLLTSPTADSEALRKRRDVIEISNQDIEALPFSVVLGFILPTAMWLLPVDSVISSRTMQLSMFIWQPFPLYMVGIQRIFKSYGPSTQTGKGNQDSGKNYINVIPLAYRFVLAICVMSQVPTLLLLSTSTLSFNDVFFPAVPSLSWRMNSVSNGVHIFLIWDFYTSAVPTLLWTLSLIQQAKAASKEGNQVSWTKLTFEAALWTVLGGPVAAATVLIWHRDSMLTKKLD